MYSRFPFSMENIPRHTGFGCFSLKFGCIFSALLLILYSVLSIAQCIATLGDLSPHLATDNVESMVAYGAVVTVSIVHCVTLFLTAVMLVGTLRDRPRLMKPWIIWNSILVSVYLMLFVFWTATSMVNRSMDNSLIAYIVEFMSLLIRFYMLMLVSSYQKQLEEEMYGIEPLKLNGNDKQTWYSSA